MAAAEAVKEKILNLAEETFLGSGDLEAQDAKSFHQYFVCVCIWFLLYATFLH